MSTEADFRKFFKHADADNSGFLTLDELCTALQRQGYKDRDIKNMFIDVDTSGDNKISIDEFLTAMGCIPPTDHGKALMRQTFRKFDRDGNGSIDASELNAVFQEAGKQFSDAELKRMIAISDKDKSGTMEYEEFISAVFGK